MRRLFAFVVAYLGILTIPTAWAEEPRAIAVVVNETVTTENLSQSELLTYIRGEKRFWRSRQRVELILRADESHEREVWINEFMGMSELQFRQYWITRVFSGRATTAPRQVLGASSVAMLLRGIPGALTIVDAEDIPEDLKVLKIDGLLPDETGYPLIFE